MFKTFDSPALQSWPASYRQARANLLAALQQQPHPLQHDAVRYPVSGADDELLYTDIVWLGRQDAPSLLVLISATHGVEGFAGAAIQHDALLQLASMELPPELAVLIIHALNPWGFSHQRRVNEDGVDLNRNTVDFSQPLPDAPDYQQLADAILPDNGDWETADRLLAQSREYWGAKRFQQAVAGGQYTHPQGLFYGGDAPSFSRRLIEERLANWHLGQRQVLVLDLHTGLGPFGHGELICDHPADSPASRKAQQWYGPLVTLPENGDSCSVPLAGLMDYLWHAAMRPDGMYLTLEYGTYPIPQMLHVLRRDHWLYAQAGENLPDFNDPQALAIRAGLHAFFDPDSLLWRESVLLRARQVIRTGWRQLLAGNARR